MYDFVHCIYSIYIYIYIYTVYILYIYTYIYGYIRKEHVENNLFVKYYVRMANFNKVIKGFKYKICSKFAMDLARDAIETTHSIAKYH